MIEGLITEFGPVIAICAYLISKDAKQQEQTAKEMERREQAQREENERRTNNYKEILDGLREDSKAREEALLSTLNSLTSTMDKAFHDFSKTLNVTNESMIEVSTQLGNLGVELHREFDHLTQRMGDVEHGMDRINEKLSIQKNDKQKEK